MKESLLPSVSGDDFMKMNRTNKWRHGLVLLMGMMQLASAQYNDWQFSGAMWLLTTPEGTRVFRRVASKCSHDRQFLGDQSGPATYRPDCGRPEPGSRKRLHPGGGGQAPGHPAVAL